MHPVSSTASTAIDHFDSAVDCYVGQRGDATAALTRAVHIDPNLIVAHSLRLAMLALSHELVPTTAAAGIENIEHLMKSSCSERELAISRGENSGHSVLFQTRAVCICA
jgi:hypothetical protein